MTPTNLKVLCCTKPEIAKRDEKEGDGRSREGSEEKSKRPPRPKVPNKDNNNKKKKGRKKKLPIVPKGGQEGSWSLRGRNCFSETAISLLFLKPQTEKTKVQNS
jgi:hypothetical protein